MFTWDNDAASLLLDTGQAIRAVAQQLDLGEQLLGSWVKKNASGAPHTEIKKKKQEPRAYTTMSAPVMADMIARRDADQ